MSTSSGNQVVVPAIFVSFRVIGITVYDAGQNSVEFYFDAKSTPIDHDDGDVLPELSFRSIGGGCSGRAAGPMREDGLRHQIGTPIETVMDYGFQVRAERSIGDDDSKKSSRWKFRKDLPTYVISEGEGERFYDDSIALQLAVYTALRDHLAAHPHAGEPIKAHVARIVRSLRRRHKQYLASFPFMPPSVSVPAAA